MAKYIKCPRCELNYIIEGKQEYCDVCIAEMKGSKLRFADLEDEELEEVLEDEAMEICPVCGVNKMPFGEKMCEACRKQSEYEDEEQTDEEQDDEWKNYIEGDGEDLSLDEDELAEELAEVEEEDEEYSEESDDFFDGDDGDMEDLGDDDYDEDEDDEDDDDDLF